MTLVKQRFLKISVLLILTILVSIWFYQLKINFRNIAFYSGWILFLVILLGFLFSGFRKLPFFSLANVRFWSQLHIYLGLFAIVIFCWHIDLKVPKGFLETLITLLFIFLVITGTIGLYIYRTFAKRLTDRGEEVIYERIAEYRQQIKNQAENLIGEAEEAGCSHVLKKYYQDCLVSFLSAPRNFFSHLLERGHHRYNLLIEMRDLNRYLNGSEREVLRTLIRLVKQKDDLDYHYSLQFVLKNWLSLHVPLALLLFLFSSVHLVLVMNFTGA